MSKAILVLIAAIGIATAVVMMLRHDLEHERARANALAERVAVFEPVERPDSSTGSATNTPPRLTPATDDLDVEHAPVSPTANAAPEQPSPKNAYRGSAAAREQVERLQAALADGTPLQEYQIQALITSIDQVRSANAEKQNGNQPASHAEMNDELVQAAADILFESQLETFIELLNGDRSIYK